MASDYRWHLRIAAPQQRETHIEYARNPIDYLEFYTLDPKYIADYNNVLIDAQYTDGLLLTARRRIIQTTYK